MRVFYILLVTLILIPFQNCSPVGKSRLSGENILSGTYSKVIVEGEDFDTAYDVLTLPDGSKVDLRASGMGHAELAGLSAQSELAVAMNRPPKLGEDGMLSAKVMDFEPVAAEFQGKTSGPMTSIRTAIVTIGYSDSPQRSINQAWLDDVKRKFDAGSWGATTLSLSMSDVYSVSLNSRAPTCNTLIGAGHQAITYLNSIGRAKAYNRVIGIIFPIAGCSITGLADLSRLDVTVPGAIMAVNSSSAAHELGHSIGLGHSGIDVDGDGTYTFSADYSGRYKDPTCLMGNRPNANSFNAIQRMRAGFLNPGTGLRDAVNGEVVLHALDQNPSHGGATAIRAGSLLFSFRSSAAPPYSNQINVHMDLGTPGGNEPTSALLTTIPAGSSYTVRGSNVRVEAVSFDQSKWTAKVRISGARDGGGTLPAPNPQPNPQPNPRPQPQPQPHVPPKTPQAPQSVSNVRLDEYVAMMYQTAYGRAPTAEEKTSVYAEFFGKSESERTYDSRRARFSEVIRAHFNASGFLVRPAVSNILYSGGLFRICFGRPGDYAGFMYWAGQLNEGKITREQLFEAFLSHPETQANFDRIFGPGA